MDWLKCNICFNTYNDSNLRPHVLSCGHSFCERCLTNTIQNKSLTCPQCRKIHEINSVADLPINFVLEGLLKSLIPCSQNVSEGAISGPIAKQCDQDDKSKTNDSLKKSLSLQKELLKTSAGMCYEHPINELIFRCSSHKCWVCEKCIEERGDHPKQYCTITSFKEEMEDRRQENKISLDNEEKSCDDTFLVIDKHISYLSEKREHHISLADILQVLVNLHKNEDKNLQSEMKSFETVVENGKLIKQRLLDVKVIVMHAETLDESIAARDMVENKKVDARNWQKRTEREVNEGKLKVQTSINFEMAAKKSLEYREKFGLLQEKLEANINQSEQNIPLENIIASKDIEFMSKNESRTSKTTNDDLCKAHHKAIKHRCLKCQRWICNNCLNSHTSTGCTIIISSTAVKNMKDEHTESIDVLLSLFEEDIKYLLFKIQKHNDNLQEITDKKKELSEQAEKHAIAIEKIQNLLEQGKLQKDNVVNSKKLLNDTNSPYAVMDKIEVLDEMKQALRSWTIMNLGKDISDNCFPQYIAEALRDGEDVCIEMVTKDQKGHGKCSQHENNIYFHTFRAEEVTHGSICMPYDRLKMLIPPYPFVFMELSLGGTVKGKITIRLDVNLPNIRENMVNIVTGKGGLSLAGIELDFYDDNSIGNEELSFSEVPVTATHESSETSIAKKSDVIAFYEKDYLSSIYFQVGTYDYSQSPYSSNFKVIGSINTGLDILLECYDNHSNGVQIKECGIVLESE